MKTSIIYLALLAGAAGLMAGCKTNGSKFSSIPAEKPHPPLKSVTVTNSIGPELLQPGTSAFTLGPGDRIDVEIIGKPETKTTVTVGPDGKIYYYLLDGLDVWGSSLADLKSKLEHGLERYLTEPQVSLTLREVGSQSVWIMGRLSRPGIYPLSGPMTLLESLSLAGGTARSTSQVTTEELADLRHSFVMRQGKVLPVNFYALLRQGDTSQNIYLQPDDFVFVPSSLSQEVYVLGAVKFPRAVSYVERMTLVSAIAGASGPVRYELLTQSVGGHVTDAALHHVAIVRGSFSEPQITTVDYWDILKGRTPDVELQPGDIVYVPNSPMGTVKSYVNMIINTFVSTVAANEGLRAGGGGNVGIGVTVPVGGVAH